MELCSLLHFGVGAIEKGAFRSPLTKVSNFTLLLEVKLFGLANFQVFTSVLNQW